MKNVDRLLPSQLKRFYAGDYSGYYDRMEAMMLSMLPCKSVHEKFDIKLKDGVSYADLGSDINTLYFYQMLINLIDARTILEIGTYIGVSTLFLQDPECVATVTSIESGKEFYDIACKNITHNNPPKNVNLIHGQ